MAYEALAASYDRLTQDIPYEDLLKYYKTIWQLYGKTPKSALDLACGTGSLSVLLAGEGLSVLGVDASAEMLSVFQQKLSGLPAGTVPPLLLCQRAEELDLYDTVDGAVCCLDSMNYLPPELLPEVFRRLRLFISPGGRLCFDFLAPEHMRSLDGECFVDEGEDMLCLWRAALEGDALRYGMDLFRRQGRLWRREQEEHVECMHEPGALAALLEQTGFGDIRLYTDGPQADRGRRFLTAVRV